MKNLIHKVYNCEKDSAAFGIANAILWATVMLLVSWLSRGSEHADALYIVILNASIAAFLFTDRQRKNG